ncbi:auxin-responsive protein SAUR50 [Elaeis guineensis]|uniref:Indole-3-acetic acid-induced protein ARG7 n=1 Tax=Elaeis guineensis var. tenera TaxID=51953 RepID=A0A6I9SC82_ELAGV|nr:indole-3-acetic acid-induced protein ARG7 [Elaeis guineensis]
MAKANFIRRSSVLKHAVRVLQRISLPLSKMKPAPPMRGNLSGEFEEADRTGMVPEDVKEGHFAVVAVFDEKPKRFVVSLSCLSHPMFLRLLELAEEEFGFRQEGPLAVPCRPSDLEKIILEL